MMGPLTQDMRGVVFDLEGTLYRGDQVIPGAVEAVARLRAAGLAVAFLTNTTSRGRAALTARLNELGFQAAPEEVFCPSAAAADFLRRRGDSAWLLVPEATAAEFDGVRRDDRQPDWIVIGDIGDEWSFAVLNRAFRLVHERGARLLALVRSRYWLADDGLRLDAGPLVVALEFATGTEALTFGKPSRGIFDATLAGMGIEAGEAVMVGDDPVTDIDAARDAGLRTVLVMTGKYRPGATDVSETATRVETIRADAVIGSVAEL